MNFPKEVLFDLALELNTKDILSLCLSSQKTNNAICNNDRFWQLKLYKDYPFSKNLELEGNYKEIYIKVNKIIKNIELSSLYQPSGFETPVYIKPEMKEFLLNTNFRSIDGIPVNFYLVPLLKYNVANRIILTILFTSYLKNLEKIKENGETYYKVDQNMNTYLSPYLEEIEKEDLNKPERTDRRGRVVPNFNRNKFKMNRILSISTKGIRILTKEEMKLLPFNIGGMLLKVARSLHED